MLPLARGREQGCHDSLAPGGNTFDCTSSNKAGEPLPMPMPKVGGEWGAHPLGYRQGVRTHGGEHGVSTGVDTGVSTLAYSLIASLENSLDGLP
jgi:hypothetical protein